MCGIVGIVALNEKGRGLLKYLPQATDCIAHRGPDFGATFVCEDIGLGHRRLSIIDMSDAANQPMSDETGRYTIVFNGEIFNYKDLRSSLIKKGVIFRTQSDTEVLLKLFIYYEGEGCLNKLNGFFAFAIYDKADRSVFIARDRFGIKPLVYYQDGDKFLFASEIKALLAFPLKKEIDTVSLFQYLQLTYVPYPTTLLKNICRLPPGHSLRINGGKCEIRRYYQIPKHTAENYNGDPYKIQKERLFHLIEDAVKIRLQAADVPVGVFLSGGVDSSIVAALASLHFPQLKTFSIGYHDAPLYDETSYAETVAKKYGTTHTVFRLSREHITSSIFELLESMDEPLADPSSVALYTLSKLSSQHVKVALTGEGADELFAGYKKHFGEYWARNDGMISHSIRRLSAFWNILPKSHDTPLSNLMRQIHRFAGGAHLSAKERYWYWCSFMKEAQAGTLLNISFDAIEFSARKEAVLRHLSQKGDLNEMLYLDASWTLPSGILRKGDLTSMAHGQELRMPFLDYRVVDYTFSLSSDTKIDRTRQKKILRDTFKELLPSKILNRSKHGFDVPLLEIFRNELRPFIFDDMLSDHFVQEQGIFNPRGVQELTNKLFSTNPEEVVRHLWTLITFQHWYKRNFC